MKKKTVLVVISLIVLSALLLCGAALNNGEEKEENAAASVTEQENKAEKSEPKYEYSYLKGTRYKNLLATKYPNLMETMKKEEPVAEQPGTSGGTVGGAAGGSVGGNQQQNIGSAQNPGYVGGAGKYSLQDKTVAAHLTVQGTNVQNRAVWQADGNTNYFTNGSYTWAAGSAHLRSGSLSQNTVIYGHNWNNCFVPFKRGGGEFESLMSFVYEDFVAQNQYIYLTTNGGTHTFQVFAVCFTTDLNFYINCNNINVASVAARAKSMSLYDFGVNVDGGDKLITLSTCTRYYKGLGANQRFIIMGKLISTS